MLEANFVMNAGQADYTPVAAQIAGNVVEWPDGRAAVVKTDLAIGEKGAVYLEGIFDGIANTAEWFDGDPLWWDVSANEIVGSPTAADDPYIGTALGAKAAAVLRGRFYLNAAGGSPVTDPGGIRQSLAVHLAHDTVGNISILDAADNKNGVAIYAFFGVVTETIAGSTEDQLILALEDDQDNEISTITSTNTTPDVAGDLLQGTLTVGEGATGVVLAIIPADRGAQVNVSQATAGTPAGEVDLRIAFAPLI